MVRFLFCLFLSGHYTFTGFPVFSQKSQKLLDLWESDILITSTADLYDSYNNILRSTLII